MAVIFDRSSRTFIVTLDKPATVREHHADQTRTTTPTECANGRLRSGGREIVNVLLRASPTKLSSGQIKRELPHVPETTLFMRLRDMSRRGALVRSTYSTYGNRGSISGHFRDFLYGLTTAGST